MHDYTYRYAVEVTTLTGGHTPAGWPTRQRVGGMRPQSLLGKPTDAKLAQYVADFNASLTPGGVNAHIGLRGRITAAQVVDHHNNRAVVARWEDK